MALRVTPVDRNLRLSVTLLGLEVEDLLIVGVACVIAMLTGQFLFPGKTIGFLPMNWALALMVLGTGVPGLMLLKYGKPRHYLADLIAWHTRPKLYSGAERDSLITTDYFDTDEQ